MGFLTDIFKLVIKKYINIKIIIIKLIKNNKK